MKIRMNKALAGVVIAFGLCLGLSSVTANEAAGPATSTSPSSQPAAGASSPALAESQAQGQPDVAKQQKEAQEQAQQGLDKDAIAAIAETQKAIKAIADAKNDEAISAIERATGKIAILVARKPNTALAPVNVAVEVIDIAPRDPNAIKDIAKAAEKALGDKDYPRARVLLHGLTSEVRIRTFHLPLATYPLAMQEAARLLDQKKAKEASAVLISALRTLVVVDRGIPLPLSVAETAVNDAQAKRAKDKAEAQRLLALAKDELERAKMLGYAGNDPEYAILNQLVSDLEQQLQGNTNTTSTFSKLKEKIGAFFKRQSDSEKKS